MSLTTDQLLVKRETLENFNKTFEDQLQGLDAETLFKDIIGLEVQKRQIMDAITASDPIHTVLIGPAGNGKSSFLKAIEKAFPNESIFIDSTISSGIGMIERILEKGHRLRYLLVDELERFDSNDRIVFLGLLEGGNVKRDLKDSSRSITGLKVYLVATCNNIELMQKKEKPLINRCDIINIPSLEYETFIHVAGKRLLREKGIETEEIARYIAGRVYHDLGKETDMRKAIRLSRRAHSRSRSIQSTVSKDIIDDIVMDMKQTHFTL